MGKKVFISTCEINCEPVRLELSKILINAGLEVVIPNSTEDSIELLKNVNQDFNCSVHILGNQVGEVDHNNSPLTINQILEAKKLIGKIPGFRVFIWNIEASTGRSSSIEQIKLINDLRNNLDSDMIFTNVASPVQLVDDVRSMLTVLPKIEEIFKEKEVFVMYNFIDEEYGGEIVDMLSDIMDVEPLIIGEHPGVDYGSTSMSIFKSSKLAVIFFSEATSWAIPFIQQIWKLSGGASAMTPIMLIGDEDNDENSNLQFKAPNVTFKLAPIGLIPLEVKITLDKITGKD